MDDKILQMYVQKVSELQHQVFVLITQIEKLQKEKEESK